MLKIVTVMLSNISSTQKNDEPIVKFLKWILLLVYSSKMKWCFYNIHSKFSIQCGNRFEATRW